MKRFARIVTLALSALASFAAGAQPEPYLEGEHYRLVRTPTVSDDPGKIAVVEVFRYGCPHCAQADPYVENWLKTKPGDVAFTRSPTSQGLPDGMLQVKAYYAAEALGVQAQVHPAMFAAIHQQHLPMQTEGAIGTVYQRFGIKPEDFTRTFNGFAVDSRVRRSEQQVRDWGLASVPTMVVNGKYWTNATLAGGNFEAMFKVVDFLVAKSRAEKAP